MISIIYCPHPYFRQHNQLKMNRFPHVWYIIDSMVHTISPKYEWSQTKNMASSPQFTHFSDKMSLYPNICIAIVTNLINKWFGTSLFCHCSQNVTIGVVTIGGRGLLHPWGVPLVNPSENSICTCLLQVSLHSVMCPIHLLCHSLPALSLLQKCPKSYCTVLSEDKPWSTKLDRNRSPRCLRFDSSLVDPGCMPQASQCPRGWSWHTRSGKLL